MEPDSKNKPIVRFSTLVEAARGEIPPSPDLRLAIRQRLRAISSASEPDWIQILLDWASRGRVQSGFCTALVALTLTAYWELSRPEPTPPGPPMPMFLIDRVFTE